MLNPMILMVVEKIQLRVKGQINLISLAILELSKKMVKIHQMLKVKAMKVSFAKGVMKAKLAKKVMGANQRGYLKWLPVESICFHRSWWSKNNSQVEIRVLVRTSCSHFFQVKKQKMYRVNRVTNKQRDSRKTRN